jgi:two-component system, response regulator
LSDVKEKTILLVEDNENDIFLTERALVKSDVPYRLIIVRDGVEALDYLFSNTNNAGNNLPDVVLLDLKLPRVDGFQVLKEIRSHEKTRYLAVKILTSSSQEQDIAAANKLGATSYSVKPTNAREYYDLIKKLV